MSTGEWIDFIQGILLAVLYLDMMARNFAKDTP
jgi:hypothetical protein